VNINCQVVLLATIVYIRLDFGLDRQEDPLKKLMIRSTIARIGTQGML
jgi:hypothetical protein